jgi:hypothetical protein
MGIGRVKSDTGVNLRAKPNGIKKGVIGHNQLVELLEEVTFCRIKTAQGRVGYVHGAFLEKMPHETHIELSSEFIATTLSEKYNQVTFFDTEYIDEAVNFDRDFVPALKRVAEFA